MIKRILLIALLAVFVLSCKTKQKVTYGKGNTTKEVQSKRKVATQNQFEGGSYALPEDNGKFMRYEINSVDAYIEFFSETAQLEMKAYGIPASITLAQGLLESGLGKGTLAMKTNNHFGIKCHTGWTGDYVLHDDDEKDECFRKYNHPMYSYRDHSIFLSGRSRYASLFDLETDDYEGWARGLQRAGYATDRKYPDKLISLIERYKLQKFDNVIVDASERKKGEDISWVQENVEEIEPTKKTEPSSANSNDTAISVTHTVVKGDSLWALARKYGVTISELRKWNNKSGHNLSIGQRLIVKKN